MNKLNTSDQVRQLLTASTTSAALGASIETGLLWLLAEHPLTGDEVSLALKIPRKRTHYWMQLLTCLGILERSNGCYIPSSLARSTILETRSQRSWQHLVMDERERAAGVHNLSIYISEPGSIWTAQGLTESRNYVEKMRVDPDRARDFARLLYELHQYLGEELAALLDLDDVHRLMDLGGGSGVVSMALLRKYSQLTSTVIDIDNTCIAGREIASEIGLSDRMDYQTADFITDDLPGGFDMVLLCDVTAFNTPLFRKLHGCLNPGGSIVLVDWFAPEENFLPIQRLEWGFLDSLENPNFTCLTIPEVNGMLSETGFSVLRGVHVLSDKRLVIQAVKRSGFTFPAAAEDTLGASGK